MTRGPLPVVLSPRQRQVLDLLAAGRSRPEMAAELHVALGTVSGYIKDLYAVLGVHSSPEAIATARQLGLLAEPEPAPPPPDWRRILTLVLDRDFETAYSLAIDVAASVIAAEQADAAAAPTSAA